MYRTHMHMHICVHVQVHLARPPRHAPASIMALSWVFSQCALATLRCCCLCVCVYVCVGCVCRGGGLWVSMCMFMCKRVRMHSLTHGSAVLPPSLPLSLTSHSLSHPPSTLPHNTQHTHLQTACIKKPPAHRRPTHSPRALNPSTAAPTRRPAAH
jgi:hypothetical protein